MTFFQGYRTLPHESAGLHILRPGIDFMVSASVSQTMIPWLACLRVTSSACEKRRFLGITLACEVRLSGGRPRHLQFHKPPALHPPDEEVAL